NHIVYFGDGVSAETTLRGFRLTGANGYTHDRTLDQLESNDFQPGLQPGLFYYLDGGAIKIFGRSWPTIENINFEHNWSILCGGAVSIEHRKLRGGTVRIRNCIFRKNNCPGTGAAVDVLEGSSVEIENCLFVANIANTGMEQISREYGLTYNAEHGSGALTVFPGS
ncbi:MAG: right-handed parallel beta-helix repeat-containing protein, partial [Planctomycetales bacterium]